MTISYCLLPVHCCGVGEVAEDASLFCKRDGILWFSEGHVADHPAPRPVPLYRV